MVQIASIYPLFSEKQLIVVDAGNGSFLQERILASYWEVSTFFYCHLGGVLLQEAFYNGSNRYLSIAEAALKNQYQTDFSVSVSKNGALATRCQCCLRYVVHAYFTVIHRC